MADPTPVPSPDEWRALYRAAVTFRDLAPWRWMVDSDLFGVANPEDGTVGYCCVLGNLGQQFGLAVYLGDDGLRGYLRLQAGEVWPPDGSTLFVQHCLLASFENRAALEPRDRATIKAVGLSFRGANAWPQFRSFLPGYWPWYLTAPEARFLTVALAQSCVVAERISAAGPLHDPRQGGRLLVRNHHQGAWRDHWTALVLGEPPPPALPPLDGARLERIRRAGKGRGGTWESDRFYGPQPVQADPAARPYFPLVGLTVDRATGLLLPPLLCEPAGWPAAYQAHQLALLEQAERLPRAMVVRDPTLKEVLAPLTTALEIRLRRVGRLPQVDAAREGLVQALDRM